MLADDIQALRTDAPGREVHHALEGGIVVAVGKEAQIRERIFDLRALEEPQAAVDLVGNPARDKRLFKHSRLCVGTIEDRDFPPAAAVSDPVADAVTDELGLVSLVEGGVEADRIALRAARPQILPEPAGVMGNESVRRRQNGSGGAIVLLQAAQHGVAVVPAELVEVFDSRSAPAIDRLLVVTDREGIPFGTDQQLHPRILDRVRILELVDQHVMEAAAIVCEQLWIVARQLESPQQELGEVDHAGFGARLLIVRVELDELGRRGIVVALDVLGTTPFILVRVDETLHLTGYPARLVEILCYEQLLDEALLVFGVQDLETL